MLINKDNFNKHLRAFSIIELSLVLLITGILLAGISKGIDLYASFRLNNARALTQESKVANIPNLTFWLDTTSEKSFTVATPRNGDAITLWKDINPTTTTPINLNSVPSANPTYLSSGINSLPAINFNGNNQSIERTNVPASDIIGYNQASMFVVQIWTGGASWTVKWQNYSSPPTRFSFHALWSNSWIYFDYGLCCNIENRTTTYVSADQYLNLPKILSFIKKPTFGEIYQNGQFVFRNNSATAVISPSIVGNLNVGQNVDFPRLVVGEVIIYSRGLEDDERKAVESYLSQKWGIRIN